MSTLYNPLDYKLSDSSLFKKIILPGEFLYIFCNTYKGHFFVKAIINEVNYVHNVEGQNNSVWMNKDLSADKEKYFNKQSSLEKIRNSKIVNQFPWVDWPLGHAAYIGDYGFFTLEEARKVCGISKNKGKYRRAKNYFSNTTKFIYETHLEAARTQGFKLPEWPWKSRKQYYRKVYA